MNTERNKKIEEILNSLDGSQRAAVPGFFYTRLKARLEREQEREANRIWIFRPAYALAVLTLILLINGFVILKGNTTVADINTTTTTDTEAIQSIAAEYSLNDNTTMYDLTQEK